MKRVAVVMSLLLAVSLCAAPKEIGNPIGFHRDVYDASFALYVSSKSVAERSHNQTIIGMFKSDPGKDRFTCTVTAFAKVNGGYLLVGAGHCTAVDSSMPADLTYGVSENIGSPIMPVTLLKAKESNEPATDFAVYYFPTQMNYPTIALGNESDENIGDKTVDANFSLGVVKMVSEGTVVSKVATTGQVKGFYLVDQSDSHGASGSAVISEKNHKIIGLVIAGWDGTRMPSVVEPISTVEANIKDIMDIASKVWTAQ